MPAHPPGPHCPCPPQTGPIEGGSRFSDSKCVFDAAGPSGGRHQTASPPCILGHRRHRCSFSETLSEMAWFVPPSAVFRDLAKTEVIVRKRRQHHMLVFILTPFESDCKKNSHAVCIHPHEGRTTCHKPFSELVLGFSKKAVRPYRLHERRFATCGTRPDGVQRLLIRKMFCFICL